MMTGALYKRNSDWYLEYKIESSNTTTTVSHKLDPKDITLEIEAKYKTKDGESLVVKFDLIDKDGTFEIEILHIEGDYIWSDIFKRYHDTYRSHFLSFEGWLEKNYYIPKRKNSYL